MNETELKKKIIINSVQIMKLASKALENDETPFDRHKLSRELVAMAIALECYFGEPSNDNN